MPHILTLLSPKPLLTQSFLTEIAHKFGLSPATILCEGKAAEFSCNILSLEAVKAFLQDAPIDCAITSANNRRKKILIADMDSTMIEQECIDELADYVGKKAFVSEITERAMRGEIAFEPALRERVLLLKGLPLNIIDEVITNRITLMEGGTTLVKTMQAHGAYCALVSGGFTLFTQVIAAKIGFNENRANILLSKNGHLSGFVQEPILGKEAKLESLQAICKAKSVDMPDTLAVGDGANDLAMIKAAGLGVAYHAKPAVAAQAHAAIIHNNLEALLYLQGYKQEEFMI